MKGPRPADEVRSLIFDMDGTLFSTQALIVHCVNETSRKYLKRTLPSEDSLWDFGPPARNIIRHLASSLPGKPIGEAVDHFDSLYRGNFHDKAVGFQGIPELLQDLRSLGKRLAIVTSDVSTFSHYALNAFKIQDYFDVVITSDHVTRKKPDPEGIFLALQKLQLGPQDCMLIGDSATDIVAGRNAGLLTGAALWGSETWGDPRKAQPDYLFSTVRDLSKFFMTPKTRTRDPQP